MWYLKTKMGTFWVVESEDKTQGCYLGVGNDEIGVYHDPEQAANVVHDQATGYLNWDLMPRVEVPKHIGQWNSGDPSEWGSH